MTLRTAVIRAARMLSSNVRELTIDPGGDFSFVAGQWVSLRIPLPNGEFVARSYSIASAPRADNTFELAITRVDGGPGSSALHAIAPGTSLEMSHAQGFFTLDPVVRPVLFVGTGTGVSPLRSMLHASLDHAPERDAPTTMTLLFGVRTEHDILYREEFESLARSQPARFSFEPTLSRADDAWSGRRGYVQTHVRELVARAGGDVDVYICGLHRMVKEVRAVLKNDLHLSRERIHSERYD